MKTLDMLPTYFVLVLVLFMSGCSTKKLPLIIGDSFAVVPLPQQISRKDASFVLDSETQIFSASSQLKQEIVFLQEVFKEGGLSLQQATQLPRQNYIEIELRDTLADEISEKYYLSIDSSRIQLTAYSPKGVFWGIQTLRQLLPNKFYDSEEKALWGLPAVDIVDYPIFVWRGMLLDCCRHFFSKEVLKKYIDLLAYYKMNTLHWHLTEDQGWRLAIDAYPRLTEVGSWRMQLDSTKYGGFYTKEDVREIVAYAQKRHVVVVPEIEMPGHSQAAIAAYPSLSCTGKKVEVANQWGVFKEVYCAGNEQTFEFLETVLLEVFTLFPSEYIHIGGDECPKYRWKNCSKCQKRMQEENIEDEGALQSYFIKRMAVFLAKHQKKLIGWDEILEGGLAQNTIVQSWRGMQGAKQAALSKQYSIASPTSHAYFDYDLQAIDLQKVYQFDPIPKGLTADQKQYILGGECNMWTERVPDEQTLDSKVFPRLLAMSEVLWTYPSERNYASFYQRVQKQYPFLDAQNVAYGAETIPIKAQVYTSTQSINVKLIKAGPDLNLKYAFNDTTFQVYEGVLSLQESGVLVVQAFKNKQAYGAAFSRKFDKHMANGILADLGYTYAPFYSGGGALALTNGIRGTLDFRDGNWQAVQKESIEVTLDLGKLRSLKKLSTAFIQKQDSWMFLPKEVQFYVAKEAGKFERVATVANDISARESRTLIKDFSIDLDPIDARYVKLVATNIGYCPEWHAAPGSEAWLFIDEFLVE